MYCFTGDIHPDGPFLALCIGVSAEQQACFEAKGRSIPPPLFVKGLVDTGATMTCIDLGLPKKLTLNPRRPMSMFTPSTGTQVATSETYDVRLSILPTDQRKFPYQYHRPTLHVVAQPLAAQGFGAIIGRDILDAGILHYDGTERKFTLKFL